MLAALAPAGPCLSSTRVQTTPRVRARRSKRCGAVAPRAISVGGDGYAANGSPEAGHSPALMELLQSVATGVMSASDAAVQLNAVTRPAAAAASEHGDGGGEAGPPRPPPALALSACPEVVWGEGKTPNQLLASLQRIAGKQGIAAATRVGPEAAAAVTGMDDRVLHSPAAHMLTLKTGPAKKLPGTVALICAGTASPQVVEECRLVLQAMGCYAFKLPESGVMGMHRIVRNLDAVQAADVVVCVTGMDGGIASVVAGLVDVPVVALPTSAGYGTAFGGVTPLLAALNSAAPGVTVVNIDSGFGAAMAAWRILVNAARVRNAVIQAHAAAGPG
ncbi:hypothetical protein ACKKBG_A10540 [Auxenochlorella protothecoides x Auxenochlorella symbiontica]